MFFFADKWVKSCSDSHHAHAGWLQGLFQNQSGQPPLQQVSSAINVKGIYLFFFFFFETQTLYFVFSHEQGEHAQSFQVQGVLPSGVSKPQREVWHWRPGLFGKKNASGKLTHPVLTVFSAL